MWEFYICGGFLDGKSSNKLSVYNPSSGMTDIEGNIGIERNWHVAALL